MVRMYGSQYPRRGRELDLLFFLMFFQDRSCVFPIVRRHVGLS